QARGESVDKRADIWAFGVVFYEMLTGAPLFVRQTVAETVAAVLDFEPDWNRVPPKARSMLQACLQKNPKRRLRDIADTRLLLDPHPERAVSSGSPRSKRSWIAWSVAAVCAIAAVVFAWAPWRIPAPAAEPIRFQVSAPGDLPASAASAISPNGRYLAFL